MVLTVIAPTEEVALRLGKTLAQGREVKELIEVEPASRETVQAFLADLRARRRKPPKSR